MRSQQRLIHFERIRLDVRSQEEAMMKGGEFFDEVLTKAYKRMHRYT
ncbi:MAG TPA: hypothetical protein VMW90_05525 [Acidobacteriota bacterium]|nr:hypothetical protein [Acidobacteriota bacterium]